MPTPGAVISGLTVKVSLSGPRLEKFASWSCLDTAPTVSAASAAPGEPTVDLPGPVL